jgi:hypothetical protein
MIFVRHLFLSLWVASIAAAQPNIAEIIHRSVAVNESDFNQFPRYSRRETDVELKLDASGEPSIKSRKTVEVLMIDGSPYEKLLMRDGQPLSPEEARKEDEKLEVEVRKRKGEPAGQRSARVAKYQKSRESDQHLMRQISEAFLFTFVKKEEVNGRPAYVLDGTPNPKFRPDSQEAKLLTGMKGRIWIAEDGYHWMKVHIEIIKPVSYGLFIAKLGPGTKIEFELAPVEGTLWLPSRFVQDLNGKVLGLKLIRTRQEETYTDYHRADDLLAARHPNAAAPAGREQSVPSIGQVASVH